jgi:poly(A) polymerase
MELNDTIAQLMKKDYIQVIHQEAKLLNIRVFIIGGWVRDLLLHRPSTDLDFVVEGSGILLAEKVAHRLHAKLAIFKSFGTAMIKITEDNTEIELEFVGARKESYRSNSRNPIVENGTIEDDQNRRDFTINAMAIELCQSNQAGIIDPFGGLLDLNKRLIRTPLDPNITFSDDPLRIMRAIRFATQLNFNIEAETFNAIQQNKDRIHIISMERIAIELNKIIMSDKPSIGFILLDKSGLLPLIFPELLDLKGKHTIDGKSHKDNFYHTLEVLDNISLQTQNLYLRWAAILHDIGKASTKKFFPEIGWTFHGHEVVGAKMVASIFKRMKLPMNEKMRYVQKLVMMHLRPIALVENHVTDSAVRRLLFEAGEDVDDLMTLCHADITSKNEAKVKRYHRNFEIVKVKLIEIEEKDKLRNWQPIITGEIIMNTFELSPSYQVGVLKNQIREAILDGLVENEYAAAFQFMIEKAAIMGLKPISND